MDGTHRNSVEAQVPAAIQTLQERPTSSSGSSSGSSSSATSDEETLDTRREAHPEISSSFEKTWNQHVSKTTHWLRSAPSKCFLTPRRFSRLLRVLAATIGLLMFVTVLRSGHGGLLPPTTSRFFSSFSPGDKLVSIAAAGFEARGHHIPPQIWQVMFTPIRAETGGHDFDGDMLPYTASWLAKNPDYRYTMVGTEGANRFVQQHFGNEPRVLSAHYGLRNFGARSDLMRYLILLAEGGVYTDTDVTCLRPVDLWIPAEWRRDVKVVVGIEGDSLGGDVVPGMFWDVQFAQWTVAAAPGHNLFRRMLDQTLDRLDNLIEMRNTTIDQLDMTALEILNITGPSGWSESVFAELQEMDPTLKELKDLSGMRQPRLYGDIMVLPIDGFGMGVPHSGSTNDGTIPEAALVQHHFHGSWRETNSIEA